MTARRQAGRRWRTMAAGFWLAAGLAAMAAPGKPLASATNIVWPAFQPVALELPAGEKLTYDVRWQGVHAGRIVLHVVGRETAGARGPAVWRVRCDARTSPFLSALYEIRDELTSLIDARAGFTRSFVFLKNEGALHGTETVVFRYDKPDATLTKIKIKQSGVIRTNVVDMALPGLVHDPLSYLYSFRGRPLAPGGEVRAAVNVDRKNWLVTLKVASRERLELEGFGSFTTLVAVPFAREAGGASSAKLPLTAWVDERTRIPLRVRLGTPLGGVEAELVGAEKSLLPARRAPEMQ